jgi:hypothetical protein
MTAAIQREVDSLEQKLKEDVQTLKHEWVGAIKGIRFASDWRADIAPASKWTWAIANLRLGRR